MQAFPVSAATLAGIRSSFFSKTRYSTQSFFTNKYETVFSIFMLIVAFLCKGNPYLVYPDVLYLFVVLLVSNLAANLAFTKWKVQFWVIDLTVTWNTLVITAILYYSGGPYSYLWVLYLLPIFTASLLMGTREVAGITFLAVLSNVAFYGNPAAWNYVAVFEIAIKSAVLILAAAVTSYVVREKEEIESEMVQKRAALDSMAEEVVRKQLLVIASDRMAQVGKLTSGIIHDLSTPITVILGSARLMSDDEHPQKSDIQRIVNAALLCKNIVTNALNIARGQEYTFELLDIKDPLESAYALCRPMLHEKNITVNFRLGGELPRVNGSFVHLERMFLNLFSNASGAMREGGTIDVSISVSGDGKYVEARVGDNGPGFPEHILRNGPKAFITTKKPGEGTGLGLFNCLQTAEKHGADFSIGNAASGGAVVRIAFPASVGQPA